MIYGSVCSGIEAATMAWKGLGWRAAFVSEIEPFPRAVLKHHHPEVPLHGDFTTIKADEYEPIDLLVGGTPCQSFSVAGLRGGLGDGRGNLALEYLRLAGRLRPRWVVWENVPGVFSSTSHVAPDPCPPDLDLDAGDGPRDGEEIVVDDQYDADEDHALACFLAGLSELGYGLAYRVLDAQFTRTRQHPWAVPQRRRRLFVVGYLGDWRRAAAVLFDAESLSGNPAPGRQQGQGVAPTISARPSGGGGLGTDFDLDGGLTAVAAFGGNNTAGPIEVATALNAHGGPHGRSDFESETFIAHAIQAGALRENPASGPDGVGVQADVAYTVEARAEVQAVAFALRGREDGALPEMHADGDSVGALRAADGGSSRDYIAFDTTQVTSKANRSNPQPGDTGHPLTATGAPPAIAFNTRQDPIHGDVAQPLGAKDNGHGVTVPAVAFTVSDMANGFAWESDVNPTLNAHPQSDTSGLQYGVRIASAVRRLTPRECERLQGFPDDYTAIPWRGGTAADGLRYKALGNSMAVNVMRWLGERIALVDGLDG